MNKTETILTPQQQLFLSLYFDRGKGTFGNAYQSAIGAGYAEEYAQNITSEMPDWLSENLGKHKRMLLKAEKVLEDSLEVRDPRLKQDTAKFVAKTLGKEHYSEKTETEHSGEIKIGWLGDNDTVQAVRPSEETAPEPSEV